MITRRVPARVRASRVTAVARLLIAGRLFPRYEGNAACVLLRFGSTLTRNRTFVTLELPAPDSFRVDAATML
jgi:hypothetical protein